MSGYNDLHNVKTYNDTNLVRYEDAIRLHFDLEGTTGWLTLKNYGGVFSKGSPDEVTEAIVGTRKDPEYKDTISISARLDAIEVIKFQKFLTKSVGEKLKSLKDLNKIIENGLDYIGIEKPKISLEKPNKEAANTEAAKGGSVLLGYQRALVPLLANAPGAPEIYGQIRDCELSGFTAYFPKPSLIVEEERTLDMYGKPTGQTRQQDFRWIIPIPANIPAPPMFAFTEFLKEVDGDILDKHPEVFAEQGDVFGERKELSAEEKEKTRHLLHSGLERIRCFAFRGDTRDLLTIRGKKGGLGGFLPGITRTDTRLAKDYLKEGKEIDALLRYQARKEEFWGDMFDFAKRKKDKKKYKEIMLGKFHLGEYVRKEDFKGYISASTSIAIAKSFSNRDSVGFFTVYLYAVRCRGGFHLCSYLKDPMEDLSEDTITSRLREKHMFNKNPEQEVAVPGAIWWEDVVGMRVLKTNETTGQFFFGPVFLQDLLKGDNHKRPKTKKSPTSPIDTTRLLAVTPSTTEISFGKSVQFNVTVQGVQDPFVSWAVEGVPGGNQTVGTISKDGLYTAPSTKRAHWFTVTAATFATQANWRFHPARFTRLESTNKAPATWEEFEKLPLGVQYYSATAAVHVTEDSPKHLSSPQEWRSGIADNEGFSALFEFLSGKSQGRGPEIVKSYPHGEPWKVESASDAKKSAEAARKRWVG